MGALSNPISKQKNCFEILRAKEMGLDRAPIEFQTFYFSRVFVTPLTLLICVDSL